jgi:hypothetical protein
VLGWRRRSHGCGRVQVIFFRADPPRARTHDLFLAGAQRRCDQLDALAGRTTSTFTRNGSIGTGRRMSNTMRATARSSLSFTFSIARPRSAAGGPPCCEVGPHGPARPPRRTEHVVVERFVGRARCRTRGPPRGCASVGRWGVGCPAVTVITQLSGLTGCCRSGSAHRPSERHWIARPVPTNGGASVECLTFWR